MIHFFKMVKILSFPIIGLGKEEIVEILLQNGANAAATDSRGNTVDSFVDLLEEGNFFIALLSVWN